MLQTIRASIVLSAVLSPLACRTVAAADESKLSGKLLVAAAASTTDAIERIRADFARLHPGVTVRVSYASSSTLAQQISAGAEVDLFLSASSEWANVLSDKQLVERRRDLLSNELVIVVPADSKLQVKSPADLVQAGIRRLALADPRSVPAGVYARQALEKLKLWSKVEAKVTGAADVRQALHFVDTGAAEAGIVYATDVKDDKAVRIAARIDAKLTDPIRYPLVLLKRGTDNRAAVAFYDYLASPPASAVFRELGFVVLPASEKDKP